MSSQVTTQPPERQGVGGIILVGILLGAIIAPIAAYFGMDYLGQVGHACGGGGEQMTCPMRHIILSGMGIPVGALIGFGLAYWVASRRFNAGR
ncbi:MAG TPA: hypothetical protein VHV56_10920 [Pseudolabrys sp.]|jgi:hypothetical protein|nr:hypothetical protein [Pseudolabrys sp.]